MGMLDDITVGAFYSEYYIENNKDEIVKHNERAKQLRGKLQQVADVLGWEFVHQSNDNERFLGFQLNNFYRIWATVDKDKFKFSVDEPNHDLPSIGQVAMHYLLRGVEIPIARCSIERTPKQIASDIERKLVKQTMELTDTYYSKLAEAVKEHTSYWHYIKDLCKFLGENARISPQLEYYDKKADEDLGKYPKSHSKECRFYSPFKDMEIKTSEFSTEIKLTLRHDKVIPFLSELLKHGLVEKGE